MLDDYTTCRELFRWKYIQGLVPVEPAIHLEFGIAFHKAVEVFWKGGSYDEAFKQSMEYAHSVDLTHLKQYDRERWAEMVNYLPDLAAAYFENHDPTEIAQAKLIEHRFELGCLVGRIDRVQPLSENTCIATEVKTASAVNRTWKEDLKQKLLRSYAIQIYDGYLRVISLTPTAWKVEVAVKPYKGSKARIELIELPEILLYRSRFEAQLAFLVQELSHWVNQYAAMKPWPMCGGSACTGLYNKPCPYLLLCNYGDSPRNLEKYRKRHSILEERSNAEALPTMP